MTPALAPGVLTSLVDAALRALVFAGVIGVGLALCRVTRAAARLWAWTIVLGVALAMPALGRVVPRVHWNIPEVAPLERLLEAFVPARRAVEGETLPVARMPTSASVWSENTAGGSSALFGLAGITWPMLFLAIYLGGVCVLLLRAAMSWRTTRDLEREARPIRHRDLLDRLQRHARIAGLSSAPAIAEASALSVPVTMSVATPTIVLPPAWPTWSEARLDAVLAHEMAHVARRDTLTQRLSLVYRAIAWFSPLSWWLHARLADLAEQASDEAALAAGVDRLDYAETLLGFFAALNQAPRRAGCHVAMARGAAVGAERRVERILTWKGDRSMKLTRRFALTVMGAAVPMAVVTAAVRPALVPMAGPAPAVVTLAVPAPVPAANPTSVLPAVTTPPQSKPTPPRSQPPEPVYKPGNGVTDPVPLVQAEPKYTTAAMQARIEGAVELQIVVSADGTVEARSTRIVRSLDATYGLDQEAVKAANHWLFKPSTKDGKPVRVVVALVLTFRLHPKAPDANVGLDGQAVPAAQRNSASQSPDDDFAKGAYPEDTPDLVLPKAVVHPEPKYTSDAMRQKIQGDVVLEAVVGTDGTVLRVRVAQSLDPYYGLDDEAVKTAKQWFFEPGTLRGEKVPVLVTLTLTFRLH